MDNKNPKVVVVTGGAQGIGKGIGTHLLEKGYAVAMLDIDREAGEESAKELAPLGTVRFIHADVSQEESVKSAMDQCMAELGRIDGLVNNAGITTLGNTPVEKLSLAQWHKVLSTNLTGCFLCSKHSAGNLRKTHGSIVNIASTRALQSERNTEAYSASKGGIVALTHALAMSLGPEIRANCISPGWIEVAQWKKKSLRKEPHHSDADCAQHPCGRVGAPADIAALVAFLLSDESGFVTGQNFVVDGGMTKKMIYVE